MFMLSQATPLPHAFHVQLCPSPWQALARQPVALIRDVPEMKSKRPRNAAKGLSPACRERDSCVIVALSALT